MDGNNEVNSAEKGVNLEQINICKEHLEKWYKESWGKVSALLEETELLCDQADGAIN